ncbi:hypothetical protein NCCP2716_00830 [Sporosarcina sp. NCCP-2716]|uniref:hypothetical protein n=1 Tax=Sporosarcina sp. NCCP-2716 TaxID=2943679 RepID=UPI00203F2803|nr:hypothetical protein [Sporosarcina sp. NCCP-2716]GKV67585.1 hypothetical protein NCCP2716_00830 [Sporosarcina sp. NCCP-2716]
MALISLQAPLLFIDGPPLVMVVQVEKDESTAIYESVDHAAEEPAADLQAVQEASGRLPAEREVVRKLRYLAEPFPQKAYRPLQFSVAGQLLTGDLLSITDTEVAVKVTEESQSLEEIRTLGLESIEEVYWKGQPFR